MAARWSVVRVAVLTAVVTLSWVATGCSDSVPRAESESQELPAAERGPTTVVASDGLFPGAEAPGETTSTIPMKPPVTVAPGTPNANTLNEIMLGFEEATTQYDLCASVRRPLMVLDGSGGIVIPKEASDPAVLPVFLTSASRAFTHFAQIAPEAVAGPFEKLALAFQAVSRIDAAAPDAASRANGILRSTEVRNAGQQAVSWLAANCGGALSPTTTAAPPAP